MSTLINKDKNGNLILQDAIGVQQIILGEVHQVKNPQTGKITLSGTGKILYNREDEIPRPYFMIALEKGGRSKPHK